jgi:hypothetical protein
MHAAWSSRPKIKVFLDLHAPKVAMPISSATDDSPATTLIIDLGSLVIFSNPVEAAKLSPEEGAIYDCYGLVSYDVAVHVVRGHFAWPDMKSVVSGRVSSGHLSASQLHLSQPRASMDSQRSARLDFRLDDCLSEGSLAVPLLGHCSTTASVHVAHVSHPTLPMVRIGLEVGCPCLSCVSRLPVLHDSLVATTFTSTCFLQCFRDMRTCVALYEHVQVGCGVLQVPC